MPTIRSGLTAGVASVVFVLGLHVSVSSAGTRFVVTNLVSDGSVPAATIDPNLINPWGVATSATSPFWIADNGSGVATIYNGSGVKSALTPSVAPPAGGSPPSAPTGQVFNGSSTSFLLNGNANSAASFIFDTEDGTISGWSSKVSLTNSVLMVDNSNGGAGAVYKGLAIANNAGQQMLYAANFRAGDIEIYNSAFGLAGTFTDPTVAAGYAPFNVQALNGNLFVTFAQQDATKHDDVAGAGNGYVDEFSLSGVFKQRLVSLGGQVNSPWGLDIAPASFGQFAGDLLVGNFGDGTISAFDPSTGTFMGTLDGVNGQPLMIGDLWALINGNGGSGGSVNKVYFTAGVSNEAHGLFGSLTAVPEPQTWSMMIVGLGLAGLALRRRAVALAH